MPLTLRLQHQDSPQAPSLCGIFKISSERPWAVEGPALEIAEAYEDLRDVARRVHATVLHLDFGNSVGVFRVRHLGALEVTSGKWDESHFDSMLADIARESSALPFAHHGAGPLPYDRSLASRHDILYHAYVYVRHILSSTAPEHVRLLPALSVILKDPHRTVTQESVHVDSARVQRLDTTTLLAIATSSGPFTTARVPLPLSLSGRLPHRLPERRVTATFDTPENRLVLAFLRTIDSLLKRMREVCSKDTAFARRTQAECRALEDLLAPSLRHPIWREVGRMTHVPVSSTVLQKRRGYRSLFRHFVLLRLCSQHLPISEHEARDLLESKDISALYELWCYFKVVEALRGHLGPPTRAGRVTRDDLQARLEYQFEVRWGDGTRVLYNATFSRTNSERRAYSVRLRPDISLLLPDGTLHLLDAKFRIQRLPTDQDEPERAREKDDDLHKMHAYRDAIDGARSAWILYPGTETSEFSATSANPSEVNGVGAIPLQPEDAGDEALDRLIGRMLGSQVGQ